MENRDYTLLVILIIVTAVAVSAADAAGIPKKAISTVGAFMESDLPATTVFTDKANTLAGANTFTGANTFSHNTNTFTASNTGLVVSNPAGSFTTTLAGGAVTANRTLNLPVTSGTDTLAALGLSQTWTGTNTFNALTLGGQMNLAGNTMQSSGHVYTFPSNTGTVLLTNGSGSSLTGIVTSITGTANNVTASASTGAVTLNLGQNAVTTGGSAQTVTKQLTMNSLTLGNAENANSKQINNLAKGTSASDAVRADQLGLIGSLTTGTCSTNNILKYDGSTWQCVAPPPDIPLMFSTGGTTMNAANFFIGEGYTSTTYAAVPIPVPVGGTLKNFYMYVSAAPTKAAGDTFIVDLDNGVATGITCNVPNGGTTCSDTTHSYTVTAGQKISIKMTVYSTTTAASGSVGLEP